MVKVNGQNINVEVRIHEMMARQKIRTIKEVCERSGLCRKVVSELLNEDHKKIGLRLETIARLCTAFDCTIEDLIVIQIGA